MPGNLQKTVIVSLCTNSIHVSTVYVGTNGTVPVLLPKYVATPFHEILLISNNNFLNRL